MADDLPYKVEYAKSGRAACKGCKSKIDNAELRLAVMVQSPMFDGKVPHWYHFMCFFSKQRPKSVGDIDKFGTLRYEDQKRIQEKIESKLAAGTTADDIKDFSTEYAKSSKSTCKGCNEKIAKGEVRISKLDFDGAFSKMRGPVPQWYHVDCFVKNRDDLDYTLGAESIPGFAALGVDDQRMLKEKIKKIDRKRKPKAADETDGPPAKQAKKPEDPEEEKALKEQSDLVYKLRDNLQKNLTKKELQELLEFNNIDIPSGESRILDLLADCMAFGCLERCPECTEGQLKLRTDAYACTGNISGWTKCQYVTKEPKRMAFKVPPEFKETYPFLKKYKYVARQRVFPKNPAKPSEPSTSANGKAGKTLPLDGIEVALGKTSGALDELKQKLILLGAKPVSKVSEKTLCLVSTAEEVKKKPKKVKDAELHNVHVVSEDFIEHLAKGSDAAEVVVGQFKIAPWGGDAASKIEKYKKKSQMEKMYAKSGPSTMKLTVKGLAVVEPDSGLSDEAHVYTRDNEIFSSVLGMVDVSKGTNSYYKLQLLESDRRNRYWVYRAWGRVGTSVGSNKLEEMDSLEEAKHHFKALFEEKTGNLWSERKDFVKQPHRFYPLELDYGQESGGKKGKMKPGKNSKLHLAVQELICMIFDMDNFEKTMMEFEIDLTKMPLGKLSKRQIQQAYSVLTELSELVKNGGSESKFLDASNRFYTLIPHDFGMRKPTILNDEELIKQKIGMVDSLLEIEVAYSMLKVEDTESGTDPVDFHYSQLKAGIEWVRGDAEEFALMRKYVETTHAETHRSYKLQVLELFKVTKDGEAKRYKPFKKLPNRKLLWHGSRLSNFAGILSQGLRIAPPEAPVTGYMFGKGIYFADMVSKSANYCCTSPSNPVGLLLLCEVALGNMYERKNAEYVTKLPPNMHSTKGVGMTYPDPSNKVLTPDGVEIPLGPAAKGKQGASSLLYNEYIVYDTAQVSMKYLMKVKFDYNC